MKGLLMMLKSMGIEIDPAEIERMRVGIPQLIIDVRQSVKDFDARLKAIEYNQRIHMDNQRIHMMRNDIPLCPDCWRVAHDGRPCESRTN